MNLYFHQLSLRPNWTCLELVAVSQGQTIDSLGHHLLHLVFDQIGIPIIGEAGGKLTEDPNPLLDLSQKQTTAIATDRPTVELGPNLASLLGMKSEDKLVTLWGHKGCRSFLATSF